MESNRTVCVSTTMGGSIHDNKGRGCYNPGTYEVDSRAAVRRDCCCFVFEIIRSGELPRLLRPQRCSQRRSPDDSRLNSEENLSRLDQTDRRESQNQGTA